MQEIYLDHASTTPPLPVAVEAMNGAITDLFADPSRLYGRSRRARIALDEARATIAQTVSARPEDLVFTSGGTESCNLAIYAGAKAVRAARKPDRVVVSSVEHTAVLEAARSLEGTEVVMLPVDGSGTIDLDALRAECAQGVGLVSIQHANHELGTIQPVAEAARIAREAGAIFHTDACMTVGNMPVSVSELGVDLLSASAHKFYGPRGAGLLWVRRGVRVRPTMVGDDRERRRRAGIENLPAIMGMAAAMRARADEWEPEIPRLRDLAKRLSSELSTAIEGIQIHSEANTGLPGLVAFSIPYVDGETLLLGLDAKGLAVHSGSSCTSTPEPSHILSAIGVDTQGSVRVSLGRASGDADIDALLDALPALVNKIRH